MKTQRTFKPGDYCRFKPEEIPSIIAILKANGWEVNKHVSFEEGDDCIIADEEGGFYSFKLSRAPVAKNELSRHDFFVTALRLNEGDGMRSDMSTPEERKHITKVLSDLGIRMYEDFQLLVETGSFKSSFYVADCLKYVPKYNGQHIDYSEWCKRLNVLPIGEKSVTWMNESTEIPKDFTNHIPDVGEKVDLYDAEIARIKSEIEYHEFLLEDYKEQVRVLEALKDHDEISTNKLNDMEKVFPSDEEIAKASLTVGNPDGITDRKQAFEKGAHWMREQCKNVVTEYMDYLKEDKSIDDFIAEHDKYTHGKSILTLPDGTTVDLTKPIEVSDANKNNWHTPNKAHYIGTDADGMHVVHFILSTGEDHYEGFKHIRNKPEPDFKPGDKIWFSDEKDNDAYWHIGTYSECGGIIDQDGDLFDTVAKIRPAFIDGIPQYPPFD